MSGALPSDDRGPGRTPAGHRERAIRELTEGSGSWRNERYEITARHPTVEVREVRTGLLVAFSAMGSDFVGSVEEFVRDYA